MTSAKSRASNLAKSYLLRFKREELHTALLDVAHDRSKAEGRRVSIGELLVEAVIVQNDEVRERYVALRDITKKGPK